MGILMPDDINYKSFFQDSPKQEKSYFGDKAAGCIFIAKDTGRILLAKRTNSTDPNAKVKEPGTWGTWGGKVDNDETPKDTVER